LQEVKQNTKNNAVKILSDLIIIFFLKIIKSYLKVHHPLYLEESPLD
jgi:hypothetical protein